MVDDALVAKIKALEARVNELYTQDPAAGITYAEGSWTPAFQGAGTAGTFTYAMQVGRYTRIGNVCFVRARVGISAITVAPTGAMYITGLPLTSANVTNLHGAVALGEIHNINYVAGYTDLAGHIPPNLTRIELVWSADNAAVAALDGGIFTNANARLTLAGHYQV